MKVINNGYPEREIINKNLNKINLFLVCWQDGIRKKIIAIF